MSKKKTGCTIPLPFMFVGILFVILKLCGAITWPWFWVLFPFILMMGITCIIFGFIAIITLIVASSVGGKR